MKKDIATKTQEFNEVEETFRERVGTLEGDLLRVEEELRRKSKLFSELDEEYQRLRDNQVTQEKEYQESKAALKEEEARLADRLKDTKEILCDRIRKISALNARAQKKMQESLSSSSISV